MKKILYLVSLVILTFIITPSIASAHFSGETDPSNCNIGIRVEVSKDNGVNWYSYDSSDASSLGTGYTLKVLPGDTIKMRMRAWNEGDINCLFNTTGTTSGFEYLNTSGIVDNLDEDGDEVPYLPPPDGITNTANMGTANTTVTSGYQSLSVDATVKSDAPVGTLITLNYSVNSVSGWVSEGPSVRSFAKNFMRVLIPVANADGDGTATSSMRIEVGSPETPSTTTTTTAVQELPKTGGNNYIYLIPAAFLLPAYFVFRKLIAKFSR